MLCELMITIGNHDNLKSIHKLCSLFLFISLSNTFMVHKYTQKKYYYGFSTFLFHNFKLITHSGITLWQNV